ncbi:MAG: hypothetical protein WBL82_07775 [Terriglobales bacterium]
MKNVRWWWGGLGLFFLVASIAAPIGGVAQSVSPDLFDGLRWRLIGPFRGGRAVAVAGVPGDSTTFYFGGVDGGVWKTGDAGVVWTPIFDGQPIASIGALAVAPSNSKIIYAGTGESDIRSDLSSGNGIYKSLDGGRKWSHVGLDNTRQISRIVVDARDPQVVYVGALGHAYGPNAERGVYKSSDGGAHWTKVLDQGPETGIADLAICASNPKLLFATTWHTHRPPWSTYAPIDGAGGGLYRSLDAGKTWSRLEGHGLPGSDWGRSGVDVARDGRRVYALIQAPIQAATQTPTRVAGQKEAGLYRSDDGGDSWTLVNSDSRLTNRAWYFSGITIDPQNRDVIYMPNVALFRSEDGGRTISIVRGAPGGDDYHQLWIDPKNSSSMVLGTDQGTSISLDRGLTWSTWYNQATAQIYHVTTDNQFPYVVYGAQQDSGSAAVLSRTDHGQITPRDWFPAGGSESGYMVIDAGDPNIIYLSGTYGSVSRFNRRTGFSQDITPWPVPTFGTEINQRKYRAPWTPVLVASAADARALYLGTQYVMKTVDGGLHWETISGDLTGAAENSQTTAGRSALSVGSGIDPEIDEAKRQGYGVVSTIAPSPLDAGLIWAGSDTGRIHVTRDGGKNWNDVTPPGLGAWSAVSLIEASHFDPASAYAAVSRSRLDDQAPYIYRTRDFGATWQLVTQGIGPSSFLRAVREDPQTKGLLFAGTELGVYVSFDDGDRWQPLQLNLPVCSVRDLTLHGDDLVIATHGRSFWILDDMTPLRQAREAAKTVTQPNVRGPWLYQPAVAIRIDNDSFAGTPLPPEEPTAENPPSGAVIDYFLKAPAKAVTLDIFDAQQNLVRRFSSADRPAKRGPAAIADRWFHEPEILATAVGMHRFVWNLAIGNAAAAADEDDESRPPNPPKVPPGGYHARISVDGESAEQPLRVVMDPRSPATAEVLTQQFALAQQIYGEALVARRTLAEIKSAQKQVAGIQRRGVQSAELKSSLADAQATLEKIVANKVNGSAHDPGLEGASTNLGSALRVVESGDRAAPEQAVELYEESSEEIKARTGEWAAFKQKTLPELNRRLTKAELPAIAVSGK